LKINARIGKKALKNLLMKASLSATITDASVHDSQALDQLLEEKDKGEQLYADSAYTGQEEILEKYQVKDQIHEKGARNRPLTDDQKKNNR
jgi:IS5 family transposase